MRGMVSSGEDGRGRAMKVVVCYLDRENWLSADIFIFTTLVQFKRA